MTKEEAKRRMCQLMGVVNEGLFEFSVPSDCFCGPGDEGPCGDYRCSELVIEFMEDAIHKAVMEAKHKVFTDAWGDL